MKKHIIPMIILSAVMMKDTAQALPTSGRLITGIVQQVDVKTREVEMRRDDNGALFKFFLVRRTSFTSGSSPSNSSIIRKGERVAVRYHEPFFSKPFASRAKLLQPQVSETNSKTRSK